MNLVIVESPSKAKTIAKYLGGGYKVLASGGHVRDLPAKKLAVNVHNNFEPEYVVSPQKEATIKQLKKEVANSDKVFLATDPDREGEAISWHLKDILKIKDDNVRIVFNEITKTAVNKAIAEPHLIDMNLVDSQQARRVLDRLVGYLISPVISRKIQSGLSAGRVQSVALRMIVDREHEIRDFKPEEYWLITAQVANNAAKTYYKAAFNDINAKKFKPINKEQADQIINESKGGVWSVDSVKRAKSLSKPNAPFTTSTMQQDAVNKLNLSAPDVMKIAQRLYEGVEMKGEGQVALVTYIRTDSTRISADAQAMAKDYILQNYGDKFFPSKPNVYTAKENAQDAHEAIRPISLERTPESLKDKIGYQEYRLYKLVYDRFMASQMTNAEYDTLTVRIISDFESRQYGYLLKGKTMTFAGFTAVYQGMSDEDEDNDNTDNLPMFQEGEAINAKDVVGEQKFTKPPSRFTDSSLIKALEENGIGRPSTYASILNVLLKRTYTSKEGKNIIPTQLAELVCEQLIKYFPDIMDTKFTAEMENKLDTVAEGNRDWHDILKNFYPSFIKEVEQANDGERVKIDPIETQFICEICGKPMCIKSGKYGKFLGCSGYPDCNNIRSIEEFEAAEKTGMLPPVPKCEKCGSNMVLKGKFYGCSSYPKCTNTLNINGDGTIGKISTEDAPVCEKCGATMVLRAKGANKFFACPNYPTCKNIKPFKEIVAKCPLCGGNILKELHYGKARYKCDHEDCKFFSYDTPSEKLCPKCNSIMKVVDDGGQKRDVCLNKKCGYVDEV